MKDTIRRVILSPYRKGEGPKFILTVGDPVSTGSRDKLSYTLESSENGRKALIFSGSDFGPSPLHAWDSDDTMAALLSFLTLRPGDTDAEYFENYTPDQIAFCSAHAEALSLESLNRFGER